MKRCDPVRRWILPRLGDRCRRWHLAVVAAPLLAASATGPMLVAQGRRLRVADRPAVAPVTPPDAAARGAQVRAAPRADVPNDECSGAVPIGPGRVFGSNVGATSSAATAPCGGLANDVWFSITPQTGSPTGLTFRQAISQESVVGMDSELRQ